MGDYVYPARVTVPYAGPLPDTLPEQPDPVNHPAHYTAYQGIEVIQLTEQLNFCRGNAVKYIARAGLKSPETEVEDLQKARWYIDRELLRLSDLELQRLSTP